MITQTFKHCNYCLNEYSTLHKEKCFLNPSNLIYVKRYLIYCLLSLHRPSCQHMTRWLNKEKCNIIKPRTLLNMSKFNNFDDMLYHYINIIIEQSSNEEVELFLIIQNWLSINKPYDIDYNEKLYNQENLFNKRIDFIKQLMVE